MFGERMKIFKFEQGSEEWHEAKLGVVSTSNFDKVLNTGSGRGLYMRKLAAERMLCNTQIGYSNENMVNGLDVEPQAREYYENSKGCSVEQVGFIKRNDWVGTSPDGLVGNDGQIEIKCPIPSTHIENILKAKMPAPYRPQVQGQLWITERKWCDWISYCPALNDRPFYSVRVFRDEEYIKVLETAVEQFVSELKEMINKITEGIEF